MSRTQARDAAFKVLFEGEFQELDPDEALAAFETLHGTLPKKARGFARDLIGGVGMRRAEIDGVITGTAQNWRLDRMGRVERTVLRLGIHELLHTPDTPPAVAIDEAVEIAKRYAGDEAGAFVNGVLDAVFHAQTGPTKSGAPGPTPVGGPPLA